MTVNKLTREEVYNKEDHELLSSCTLCPRECGIDRFESGDGYCGMNAGMNIASICIHRGEEPPISGPDGICNIFFAGCNLRCVYCQNHEISRPDQKEGINLMNLREALDEIERILSTGVKAVGFVSPSHVVPQVKAIIKGIHERGFNPITVYNTNSYDKAETIRSLNGLIDVYLPDYKYITPAIAGRYSDAADYPEVALKALKVMYHQKGSVLVMDNEGRAENGILIRHLVLPDHAGESKKVLLSIAEELSTGVHISLMSQYHPTAAVKYLSPLNRVLYGEEYNSVVQVMEDLGFRNGWTQDIESHLNYRPDFKKKHPFE